MADTITDDTKVIDCNTTEQILDALVILGGAALLLNNRRLYEHIYAAKVRYENGLWLNGNGPTT